MENWVPPLVARNPQSIRPRFRAALYYGTPNVVTLGNTAFTLNRVMYTPVWLTAGEPFDRIAINVNTLAATALTRLGIYADDGNNGPGTLLLDAGTVDCSTTGDKEITITFTAPKTDIYWLAAVAQTAAATIKSHGTPWFLGGINAANVRAGYEESNISGPLANAGVVTSTATVAWVTLRAA